MNKALSLSQRSFIACLQAVFLLLLISDPSSAEDRFYEGKKVYKKYCMGCHGEKGDGKGIAAKNLLIKPRDFTLGVFKFKSTRQGSIPTDDDLKKVISSGLQTSSMPNFRLMPDNEKEKVVAYIKSLSERWKKEQPEGKLSEIKVPDFVGTAVSIKKGEELYTAKCQMCHGTKESRLDVRFFLKWNAEECQDITRPADFKYGVIKRGPKVEDIYLSITAGVEGTPMLSFANLLSDNDRWHLTSYVLNFMGKDRR
ncbi:MAG: c-type cytochrome [Nitrospirota bacterium]